MPSVERGSWQLPESLDLSSWLSIETLTVGNQVTVTIEGHELATVTDIHVKAMLGNNLVNTGSVAFGGPPGWIALYRDLSVKSLDNEILYQNNFLQQNSERTYADFQVGTNQFPCIIDGAKRDRASFGGDAFVTGRSIAYSTTDFQAWKGTIELLISHQTKDGYLGNLCPIQAPSHDGEDEPPCYGHYSLTYALLLVVSVKDFWLHSGDRALVETSWHQLERHMKFTRQFLNHDGLIEAPPYLSMTWFPMGGPVFGVSAGLNLAYYDALNAMALMSSEKDMITQYNSQASILKESLVRALWNNKQGTMRPAPSLAVDGVFQDVNAYAASLGICSEHSEAVEGIFPSQASLPVSFRGIDRWDNFQLTSPYASGFALEGLFAKGEGIKAMDLLFQVWGTMANQDSPNYSGAHWEAMRSDGTPDDFTSIAGIPRKNIPLLQTADSISGIRPTEFDSSLTTACFPNTACIASTWNIELLKEMGHELTSQAKLKNAQIILGPTINIQRDPRAGRNFECFSEDPLLSGYMAAAIVNGIQSQGFAACAKHFVCNDSETQRRYYNVDESSHGRTLREIYLAAWSFLLQRSNPAGVMTAYNKVNGTFCCDSKDLIHDVLRGEWDYKGIVMSDWFGTRSTVESMMAGVDVEMPVPIFRGQKLITAIKNGEVSQDCIDASVSRLLDLRNRTKGAQSITSMTSEINPSTNNVALRLAHEGIVLLKNENKALPLQSLHDLKVAVVGEYAKNAVFTGGGSASCNPQYRQVPLDLLREAFPRTESVSYASGVRMRRIIPIVSPEIITTDQGQKGVEISFFNAGCDHPFLTEKLEEATINLMTRTKPGLVLAGSHIKMTGNLVPKTTGTHILALRHSGSFTVEVDDITIFTGDAPDITTEQFLFNLRKLESRIEVPMEAGKSYRISVNMNSRKLVVGEPTPYGLTLAFEEEYHESQAIQEAVDVAKSSDITIIYAGRSEQYESEGFDLEEITLPDNQVAMIKEVAAASRKTVVLLHCGNPIDMDSFVGDVDAVVNMHFPGQEGPQAMVDILTGKVNPSGRLTATWFKTLQDWPSFGNFPAEKDGNGSFVIKYAEGLAIGYRAPVPAAQIQFPFGHGLSYTSFSYANLKINLDKSSMASVLKVSVSVTNIGSVFGKDVVQVYISPPERTVDWRPSRELKEFTKISLCPGETKNISIDLDVTTFNSYWCESSRAWVVDGGEYSVEVGNQRIAFVI
ncbi:hypothetical protein ACHAO7_010646 [Fusarium culmorum]